MCVCVMPFDADSPLSIDAYAPLISPTTGQPLEPVARWNPQGVQVAYRVQLLELHERPPLDVPRQLQGTLPGPDALSLSIPEAADHE